MLFIDYISFAIDDKLLGTTWTGEGYYKLGEFSGPNIWANGGRDAPFDEEVRLFIVFCAYVLNIIFVNSSI